MDFSRLIYLMETARTSPAFSIWVKNCFAVYDDKIENEVTNERI